MGAMLSVIKTLIIPAVISLLLFLLFTYVLIPLWRQYRSRYSHYLPLDTLSERTSSFRHRLQSAVGRFLVPSAWRRSLQDRLVVATDGDGGSDAGFDSDDGEELGHVPEDRRRVLGAEGRDGASHDSARRLSRDLEEGFMDDSDEEIVVTTMRTVQR